MKDKRPITRQEMRIAIEAMMIILPRLEDHIELIIIIKFFIILSNFKVNI
jgi:hypothetical protein